MYLFHFVSFGPSHVDMHGVVRRERQPCPDFCLLNPAEVRTRVCTAQVWSHVYGRDNLNVAPEDHAVLLTEAPLNPYKNRRQCAETFFENFGVPAMFCAPQVNDET